MNAANEAAVELFLRGTIGFLDIPRLIGAAMREHGAAHPNAMGRPFCPPLATESTSGLRDEVSALAARITRLDRHSRDAVYQLAEGGGGK
jgi:1-deoxy-D-xylulose-5-phosphate reductoisomerase